MARPRTKEAQALFYKIARKYMTDPRSVLEGPRSEEYVQVKREFCEVAVRDHGMQPMLIAEILGLDHSTVLYHAKPEMRERKKQTRTRSDLCKPQSQSSASTSME